MKTLQQKIKMNSAKAAMSAGEDVGVVVVVTITAGVVVVVVTITAGVVPQTGPL